MRNALIVGAAIVVAAGLYLALRPDGNSGTTTPTTTAPNPPQSTQPPPPPPPPSPPAAQVRLVVRNGKPVGGVRDVTVSKGRRVVLIVDSDVADEVHLHGYDLKRDVEPGKTVRLPFKATIVGTVVVELESQGLPLARITTQP